MGSDGKTRATRRRHEGWRRVVLEIAVYARKGETDEAVCDAVISALDAQGYAEDRVLADAFTPSVIAHKTEPQPEEGR